MHEPLRITEYGDRRIGLRAAGEIDLNSHEAWALALRRVARLGEEVHLDLSGVAFIDVRGTTLLVDAAAALPDGHRVVVYGAPPALHRVIQVLWPDGTAAITFEGAQ
ncbi:STAS domain-containing protein [Glycomyces arizonensis]|uniref:STAS domain-containing protein n=1 Tax=Glycomyces arizonensis TaxID=256035 RepID=UPI00040B4617|nr:STAS domain-containing protein [Glycomyces arizonensis]